ncbi:hypothetical protein YC2023_087123 [Brassica napus]|uniref:(rape) hypothetical protein n=1 Tax=Brassica napus TaxID=3708 RepID=A0A816NBI1_BRANA|nr:unnamed protein product [Brassica napus]
MELLLETGATSSPQEPVNSFVVRHEKITLVDSPGFVSVAVERRSDESHKLERFRRREKKAKAETQISSSSYSFVGDDR